MPQIPFPGAEGPIGTPTPPDPTLPGSAGNDQVTLEQAWSLYQARIHTHNPELLRKAGKALDSVSTLMRSHR